MPTITIDFTLGRWRWSPYGSRHWSAPYQTQEEAIAAACNSLCRANRAIVHRTEFLTWEVWVEGDRYDVFPTQEESVRLMNALLMNGELTRGSIRAKN